MKKIIITIIALVSIAGAMAFNQYSQAQMLRTSAPKAKPAKPVASVISLSPNQYTANLTAYGEVKAPESVNLLAQVSGKVNYISPKLHTGASFIQGEALASVEDLDYRYQVQSAQSALANAELVYLQEVKNGEQAEEEWLASGLTLSTASELVLRTPQLKVAKASLDYAKQSVLKAESDLAKTRIKAPFDGIIVSKNISLGSFVQPGGQIVKMYNGDRFEIALPLTHEQWQQLPQEVELSKAIWPVNLSREGQSLISNAYIARFEKHLSSDSRQRSLVVAVDQPLSANTPLYPGDFVSVDFSGVALSGLWRLPDSALTKDLSLWLLDEQSSLKKTQVEVIFSQQGYVFVRLDPEIKQAQIVVRPLASYMAGMLVTAKESGAQL